MTGQQTFCAMNVFERNAMCVLLSEAIQYEAIGTKTKSFNFSVVFFSGTFLHVLDLKFDHYLIYLTLMVWKRIENHCQCERNPVRGHPNIRLI